MKAGDIIFVKGDSLLSKIIQKIDGGKYSHVAVAISDTHVLEAQYFTKVRVTEFYFDDYDIVDLGLSQSQRDLISQEGYKYIGKWYDYLQALSYAIIYLFNLNTSQIYNSPNNMICSELIDLLLHDVEIVPYHENLGSLTPNELYEHISSFRK